ncbi:thermonuclease family protein [Viridibacterium curvum]|uniref:thermonuclease family protein n=1 Tax=Viridibacterium curvum TaxID=1101404 RepID=UPI0031EA8DC9
MAISIHKGWQSIITTGAIRSAMLVMGAVLLSLLSVQTEAQGQTLTGRVVAVADGDTLTLLDDQRQQYKIRIAGIDAPEKQQPFGSASKASLSELAFDQMATAVCPKRDRYGRSVCVVTVKGRDVGLEQIRRGMAWWYREYEHEQSASDRAEYERLENYARSSKLGLWTAPDAVPPWSWRRAKRVNP